VKIMRVNLGCKNEEGRAGSDWNPSVLDHSLTDNEQWYDAVSDFPDAMEGSPFVAEGNYRNLHVFDLFITYSILDNRIIPDLPWLYQAHEHQIIKNQQDFAKLRPNFAWLPENVVKELFKNTTQYARMPMSTVLKKHYKSPFPTLNVHRHEEALATDTVYSDVPAVDSGVTIAQLFVSLTSTVCDVCPLKTKKAFVNTLQDVIKLKSAAESRISTGLSSLANGRVNPINNIKIRLNASTRMSNGWRRPLWTILVHYAENAGRCDIS
jgi:hypothetical protein